MTNTPRTTRVRASELIGRSWLNTGGKNLDLQALRGKIVILDFWTLCCINCLHVLDELRPLEEEFSDVLVTIGVHSPKFEHEADPQALAAAIDRYSIEHPVLDDPELTTWQAYTARAWPTLVVIDPEGYIVAHLSGEGHVQGLISLVRELVQEHEAKGTLHRGDGPYVPRPKPTGALAFPGKALELPADFSAPNLFGQREKSYLVSDSARHRLVRLAPDFSTVLNVYGGGAEAAENTGTKGWADGTGTEALLNEPQGLALVPEELREQLGYDVLVCDTVNHRLRSLNLSTGQMKTLAGNGVQRVIDGEQASSGDANYIDPAAHATDVALSSPWDAVYSQAAGAFIIAMAGTHQLFAYNPVTERVSIFAGSGVEGLQDGAADQAWFAQPSGIIQARDGSLWVADSETSALRHISFLEDGVQVDSAVGLGLFDFGFVDGDSEHARLQHPLGLVELPDGSIAIADTYNGAIRRWDPATATLGTLERGLEEPSDLLVEEGADGVPRLIIVETNAHQLVRASIPQSAQHVDEGAITTSRPATELAGHSLELLARFSAPAGQKLDTRWGDPTQLRVSSTPEEFILSGAGTAQGLERVLELNPEISEAVLHITARASACDGEAGGPIPEHAACHLYQQDWGIPVKVTGGENAEKSLVLELRGVN
ncbi:MAG: NHL domain-containing thioredoxin family protein [Rothia sp. (in: high G+C Gram-positive bacteria)]|uniref:NHL domain-containing thioredoxin family protein n=1 Tax=Rothia sp. (in: high G+C Gram-positive bacteria) TaxID=1885016 RepID=UPI0026DF85EF|nr:NHL domain-containing thioredoxin family protein [Rothia sp. (in: high G+C Gram-positive bacteria)]MDO5750202.1 NHL domain-containing thioredoxin family protein [Rothia sp. (in: high G+C Gram-positive bacteria)]